MREPYAPGTIDIYHARSPVNNCSCCRPMTPIHPCRPMRRHVSSRARRGRGSGVRMARVWCVHGRAHATVGVCKPAGRRGPWIAKMRKCPLRRSSASSRLATMRTSSPGRRTHLTAAAVSKPWVLGIGSVGGQDRHQLNWMAQRIL
jgi:hypothetical protein